LSNEVGKTFKDLNSVHDNLSKLQQYEEKLNMEKGDFVNFKKELMNSVKKSTKEIVK
jgi:hypothetical protein